MGAGKASLLKAIDEEKSLRKACEKLKISYKHAWLMLKKMNERLEDPAVLTVRGGKNQGTFLTEVGRKMLAEYETSRQLIKEAVGDETAWENVGFKISARNRLPGKVLEVEKGGLVSKITIVMEPSILTSVVTEEAVEQLDIKPGDRIYAVIKSTEVMVAKRPEPEGPDENKPEKSTPEENKPEENKPEENKPEKSTPDENKPEKSTPDENKHEDKKLKVNKLKENKPEKKLRK